MPTLRKSKPSSPQTQVEEAIPVSTLAEDIGSGPTQEQIAERAYQLFLARGAQPGSAMDDWCQAERELRTGRN
jgi:Protein of unknown function (DUF2934)